MSLEDVEQKLRTWRVRYDQSAPHAGLLGRAPSTCFAEGEKVPVTADELRAALRARTRRRVRRDSTLSLGGTVYETPFTRLCSGDPGSPSLHERDTRWAGQRAPCQGLIHHKPGRIAPPGGGDRLAQAWRPPGHPR